jgi:hypothetical protein
MPLVGQQPLVSWPDSLIERGMAAHEDQCELLIAHPCLGGSINAWTRPVTRRGGLRRTVRPPRAADCPRTAASGISLHITSRLAAGLLNGRTAPPHIDTARDKSPGMPADESWIRGTRRSAGARLASDLVGAVLEV